MGDRLGIGVTGLKTLSLLNRNGPTAAGALAAAAGITSGSMTATIDKLVQSGFVERRTSPIDRRSVVVALTDEGQRTMEWVLHYYFEAISAALPDPSEVAAISQYMESTTDNLRDLTRRVPELPRD